MKTSPVGLNAMRGVRVLFIVTCIVAVTPRLSGDIILLSRLSNAAAQANLGDGLQQSQTGFLSANLCEYDYWVLPSLDANASAKSTSNSSININNPIEGLRVLGDGTASASVHVSQGYVPPHASAKLVVLSFTLTDVPYPYSMNGQLNGTSTATLTGETGTIFEKVGTALSESGTLPPGNYTLSVDVSVSNGNVGTVNSSANFAFSLDGPMSTPTPTPAPVTRATNLSTRMLVGTGWNTGGIGGFIITGTAPRRILIRGIGPSLSGVIPNAVPDPTLILYGEPPCFREYGNVYNFNWREPHEAEIIATGHAPSNDLESAIVKYLAPGAYTATLVANLPTAGVGLVEIWDLSTTQESRLANISTRANVGTGDDIVIAGVILDGASNEDLIILRGIGPTLSAYVPDPLPDPKLELRNSQGALIGSDDNWMDDPNQAAIIQAAGLAPSNNLESAIVATLMPGEYTALLSGVNNGTGVGLVEVYDNPVIGPIPSPTPGGSVIPSRKPAEVKHFSDKFGRRLPRRSLGGGWENSVILRESAKW